ncbi:hypothetical protein [Streptomyces sp. NPDC058252]|uniref:hypothetical protein n=1 Tax=Streptomyces sp. NPDC058252 TaxID=3346405 RepID=UPI0036EF0351
MAILQERAAELPARAARCADLVHAEIYGSIGPGTRAWARSRPQVTVYPDFPPESAAT